MGDPTGDDRRSDSNNRRTDDRTTTVASREGAVTAREGTATAREGTATRREDTATEREDTATVREDTATEREDTATEREDTATVREDAATEREDTATVREDAAAMREEAAELRDETFALREDAVRAREEAAQARSELELLMAQMREANGRLIAGTVRAQALTEDAVEASHLKDEFLATVSHELRTPLNAVLGWARMLSAKSLRPDGETRAIASIERNAAALAHIIDDLLDVSRIVAGTLDVSAEPVDLAEVTQVALDAVHPLALARNIALSFTPDRTAPATVNGDPVRLQQVIWNLLVNAIKFTPDGGRVTAFLEPAGREVTFRVVDSGVGIGADFLPHVFERFRQADGSTTRSHSGLGLGLAIVRQIVELHGGTVEAASQGEGHGAMFTVRLPAAGSAAAVLDDRRSAASPGSPEPRLTRLDRLRLLVVDDSPDGRVLTSLMLTQAGASVTAVGSVREAVQILDEQQPDALVTDIGLPDEDGYDLIRKIRDHESKHGGFLPAVAVTGYARAEDRARILRAGFQAHVPKPVEPAELTAAVAAVAMPSRDVER